MRIKRRKDQYTVTIKDNGKTYVLFTGTKEECKDFCECYGHCLEIIYGK